jgi:V/A-type H+-transporting ATPase subunit D
MSETTPTRSALRELAEERRAMQDGYAFLDEKCLLLAAEILRELKRYEALMADFRPAQRAAGEALRAAVARHGLNELECQPAGRLEAAALERTRHGLMGVTLQSAELAGPLLAEEAVSVSPEAALCRQTHDAVVRLAVRLAAVSGNLERLHREYRRAVRRARALHDVLLPETERTLHDLEARLEELEQEEAVWVRHRREPAAGRSHRAG